MSLSTKPPKPKACKACGVRFQPVRAMAIACSPACAMEHARKLREKAEQVEAKALRREVAVARLNVKTRGDWVREAQAAFNAWVRARDAALPCISCGRHHKGSWDAGHYLTTGARPNLRFDPANVHRQCVPCNRHLHGNLVNYRLGLLDRVGAVEVDRLEADHTPRKHTIDELREIKRRYSALARQLQKEAECSTQ